MITLTEQEVKSIENFLQDVPFKYSAPIMQLLYNKISEAKQEPEKKDEQVNNTP